MTDITVRRAMPEDEKAILAIYAHEVLNGLATFEEQPPDLHEMTSRRRAVVDFGYPFLVAEWRGAVAGYGYANAYRPRPAYRHTVENSVYVDQDFRGKGVGSALLGKVIEECQSKKLHQMIAVIGDSGNSGSIALHRRHGFREVGVLQAVGYKFDRWVDTVIMQRDLRTVTHYKSGHFVG